MPAFEHSVDVPPKEGFVVTLDDVFGLAQSRRERSGVCAPDAVFDYLTDPSKVAEWQTAKTSVEPLTDGPLRPGSRMRERTKGPGGRGPIAACMIARQFRGYHEKLRRTLEAGSSS
jgi:hypothetical protein